MRIALPILTTLLLAACGGDRTDQAVDACIGAIEEKLADRNYRYDRADMVAKAKAEGEDVVHVQSTIVFDPGLPREYSQAVECKARFGAGGGTPDIISLSFTW